MIDFIRAAGARACRACPVYACTRRLFAAMALALISASAAANDPGEEAYMIRVLACDGPDAKMEIYIPSSSVFGREGRPRNTGRPIIGYYALDLTEAGKGKTLEPVRISFSADGKTLMLDQYTRGLSATRIPLVGGTVDFDKRFGTAAKCGSFQTQ
jgi:hypothetical protein